LLRDALVEDSAELQLEEQKLPTVCTEEQGMILLQTFFFVSTLFQLGPANYTLTMLMFRSM